MKRNKLLIPLTVQFSVRYIIRTGLLKLIQEYADPIVVIGWEDIALKSELEEQGIVCYFLPRKRIGKYYERLRKEIHQWHVKQIDSPTTDIDERRNMLLTPPNKRMRMILRDQLFKLAVSFPKHVSQLLKKKDDLIRTDTNLDEYIALVDKINPDAVFCLTPYFIEEELLLKAAELRSVPICTSILSFDNLTTRNYLSIDFAEYYLWNKYNLAELWRIYPDSRFKRTTIVGAPQFDFYYNPTYIWNEDRWRKALGIPENRTVILFGGAPQAIVPHEDQWLFHLDEAIEQGKLVGSPIIIFRRHPNDSIERWQRIKSKFRHVIFDEPWKSGFEIAGKTNVTRLDIEKLASTLFYCAVHINASSTMTIDGAIFNRPQIGPAYDETGKYKRISQEIYLREHYLPITNSGGVVIAYSHDELIQAVNNALSDPNRLEIQRKKMIEEICTFADGNSTERVNLALKLFIGKISNGKA